MERYSVQEEALPCLLFVDASDPTKCITVQLSSKDPLQSLYDHALRPISHEFAELSDFWKRRDETKRNRRRLELANTEVQELPVKLSECNVRLNRATEEATTAVARYSYEPDQWKAIEKSTEGLYEDPSVYSRIEHNPVALQIIPKLRRYQNRLAEAKTIEDSLLAVSQNQASNPEHLSMERAKLEKRLARVRQSATSEWTNASSFIRDAIPRLEKAMSRAKSELDLATREKKNLETRLSEAREFVSKHSSDTLDEDEKLLADRDRSLRARGYGDDVLANSPPAAFSVIKFLQYSKRLGARESAPHSGGHNTMRILFLAANPFETSHLDLEEELRSLKQELRGVKFRDSITLIAEHAVRPDDLILHVRTHKPNVIHFSGHGSTTGIILRDDKGGYQAVEGATLKRFLEGRGVDLVVLNACYSKGQADTINGAVKTVVGTTDAVGDEAARRFTVAFYRSLGDGLSVRDAFRDGGDAVALHGLIDVFHSGGNLELTLVAAE
jgi:CHAT domain-containing protein